MSFKPPLGLPEKSLVSSKPPEESFDGDELNKIVTWLLIKQSNCEQLSTEFTEHHAKLAFLAKQ